MKILYYDCFCGISGDMNLGALLDMGVDEGYLRKELSKLSLEETFEMNIKKDKKMGIAGTKVDVLVKEAGRHSRNLKSIQDLIGSSDLFDSVKKKTLDMFDRIAKAEAKVHGIPFDEVHFHEVGAVDSIVDITGAAIALDYLKVDKIISSSVQVGGGFVSCAHGKLPVPAPATAELLYGIPIKTGLVPFETTTPTGAAILAVNVDAFVDEAAFAIQRTGYGIGSMDFEIPNVLRVYLGETFDATMIEEQVILEANIDDMSPELFGYAEEKLFKAGALDVYKTPVIMKKGRAAVMLSVLTDKVHEKAVLNVLFTDTTSIGLRKIQVTKVKLQREYETVQTKYGNIRIKNAYYNGVLVNTKPEYEDVRTLAIKNDIPLSKVYSEIQMKMKKD